MKRAAVDRDRNTGAAVLRRVDEPTEKEPSKLPQIKPTDNDKAAGGGSARIEAPNPQITLQHAQPGAGTSNARPAKWTYHEERFFFEYLRMIKGMQFRDDCVTSIATALRTKDPKQVGAYYDNIITSMKRHLNTNIKKESSLENLHYTMVVYWERVMLPNKVVKSKDSKGDTAKKPSQQQQQYRSDACNNANAGGALATADHSTGKKKTKKKHKTAASVHAPGNGTSIVTPTQSICVEEEDQNQISLLPPPPTTGAVASSGPLPVHLIKVRLVAASSVYLALMKEKNYSGAASMTLPAHTSLVDMLAHLERSWQRAMPSSSAPGAQPPSTSNPTAAIINNNDNSPSNGENGGDIEKMCCLYLEAGPEASAALQGIKWGGSNCNLDLTIGDIVALLPAPRIDGELLTLYYSWDLSTSVEKRDGHVEMGEAVVPAQQQHLQNTGGVINSKGIAPALPGEDAHDSLRRALKAALDHAAKQRGLSATEATAAAAKANAAPVPASQPVTASLDTVAPTTKTTSIGKKRQRTELEMELENALECGLNADGVVDAMAIEQQHQHQLQPYSGVLKDGGDGGERPAQKARVPVGLRNLLTVRPPAVVAAPPASKTKAKKSPKKKAASTRKKKGHVTSEPDPVLHSAQQVQQQQQQHMHAVLSQQQLAPAFVGGMPLPAGMANYLQWTGINQAQAAQVLQRQQEMLGPYMQCEMRQQQQQYPQLYAQMQQQQTPIEVAQPPQVSPHFNQGITGGMNSLFGDSMFKSLFETPLSNHPQQQPQQQQQQAAAVPKGTKAEAMPINAPTAVNDAGFAGAFSTPGKEPRTSPSTEAELEVGADGSAGDHNTGNKTISKLPIDWACLSPPPNFKLPADFGTGGTPGGRLGGASLLGGGGHSLLPSTSLLGFMDAHPKAQGAAAIVMQKGVEALFQQVGGGVGGGIDDEALAAEAAAGGGAPATDTSLHSIDSLLEKSNSNWLAPFATAQGTATNACNVAGGGGGGATTRNGNKKKSGGGNGGGQQEDVPPVCNRPFAVLT